jgi:RNA polymerase sigma factor (sigma-70 family)
VNPLATTQQAMATTARPPKDPDESLVSDAISGSSGAFGVLFERYEQMIFRIAYRVLRNREDAEDAVQQAFALAFVHLHKFQGQSRFSMWLTRIAINEALGTITGTIAAVDRILSLAGNCSGARPARQQSGPHEIPGHAGHFARSRSEIEVRGKICPGSRRGEAIRRSQPPLGQRPRQLRPVGPNRLFGPLSLRVSIFPTSYPSNEFAKRSDKNE